MLKYYIHPCIDQPEAEWVTFVHGAGGSSTIWYKQIRAFSKEYNVLLVDLRGHGGSTKGVAAKWKEYTFQSIGNDVIDVLDHLKVDKTHFVGISLGTIIIRELAERFPNRTRSLIMGGAIMKMNFRGQILMRIGDWFKSVMPYLVLYRFFAVIIMPKKSHRESRNLFIQEAKKLYQKEFERWFKLISEINPLLRFFRFKDPNIPTLYIMGGEDHMFLPSISKLVKDHSSASLVVIPECGHVVNVEKPSVFNSEVLDYLRNQIR